MLKLREVCPLSLANRKALRITEFSRHLLYRHSSHNRESHNVNCRFCGAIHSVNWACISVLSQVIRNVNERKTVQTKYDVPVRRAFRWASEQQSCSAEASMIVRIPAPWLTKEIIFVCTVFLLFTLWMTCERTLIHAHLRCELHHRICNLRYGTHGYGMSAYKGGVD